MIDLREVANILKRHGEEFALWELEEITGDADEIETTNELYTLEEIDKVSEAINEVDKLGRYGVGDLLLDVIIKARIARGEEV